MLMWTLLAVTLLLCALSSFPTAWCVSSWNWLAGFWRRQRSRALTRELARRTAGTGFAAAQDFFNAGVGLALDPSLRLLFLATQGQGRMRSALLPFAALRNVRSGEGRDNGFYDHYVEVTAGDGPSATWRLLCGGNAALAKQLEATLAGALG